MFSLNDNCKDNCVSKIVVAPSCNYGPISNGFGAMDAESLHHTNNDDNDDNDTHYRIMAMPQTASP